MVEECFHSIDDDDTKSHSSLTLDPSKALLEPRILEKDYRNQDALRLQVRLILRMIEQEEKGRHSLPDEVMADPNQYSS